MVEPGYATYLKLLSSLMRRGVINETDAVLIQFAGKLDESVATSSGLLNCTFTNLAPTSVSSQLPEASRSDAHRMPYTNESFDHVIGHAGLHHCSRPHEALHEMYRISRKSVIFIENQDSFMMRLAQRLGVVGSYEFQAVIDGAYETGGVDGSATPNFIYRWTKRDLEKTVKTFDPGRIVPVEVYREWDMGVGRVSTASLKRFLRIKNDRVASEVVHLINRGLNLCVPTQGNIFGAVIHKGRAIPQSWNDESLRLVPVRTR